MGDLLHARSIVFTEAPARLQRTGVFGWVTLTYGELELNDLAVRNTRAGRYVLTFPEHRTESGRLSRPVRPRDHDVREQIEADVIAELRRRGILP